MSAIRRAGVKRIYELECFTREIPKMFIHFSYRYLYAARIYLPTYLRIKHTAHQLQYREFINYAGDF